MSETTSGAVLDVASDDRTGADTRLAFEVESLRSSELGLRCAWSKASKAMRTLCDRSPWRMLIDRDHLAESLDPVRNRDLRATGRKQSRRHEKKKAWIFGEN